LGAAGLPAAAAAAAAAPAAPAAAAAPLGMATAGLLTSATFGLSAAWGVGVGAGFEGANGFVAAVATRWFLGANPGLPCGAAHASLGPAVAPGATLPQTPPAKAHALLALKTPRAPPGPKAAVPDAGALAAKLEESPASSSIALCTRPRIREEGLSGAAAAAAGAAATPPGMPELPSCTEGDLDSRRICSCIIC